jgi:hypothetical protein
MIIHTGLLLEPKKKWNLSLSSFEKLGKKVEVLGKETSSLPLLHKKKNGFFRNK